MYVIEIKNNMPKSPEQFRSAQDEKEKESLSIEKSDWHHIQKAEAALWRESPQRAYPSEKLKKEHPFSVEELQSMGYVWDKLDPEVKELAKSAFPEVAAFILARKLEKSSIDEVRSELKPGEDIEVVTREGNMPLFNFKGMSIKRASELGHKLGARPLSVEELSEKARGKKVDEEEIWGI